MAQNNIVSHEILNFVKSEWQLPNNKQKGVNRINVF